MSAKRKAIRQQVVQILKDAATSAADRVYGNRVSPVGREELPLILVYARSESSEIHAISPDSLSRKMRLAIQADIQSNGDIDDALDDLGQEIEDAMKADYTFGNRALSSHLVETEIDVADGGQKPYAAIRLTYEVHYMT